MGRRGLHWCNNHRQSKLKSRLDELGKIMKKLYEDNALSRITDEQYTHLSADFITERQQAEQRLSEIAVTLAQQEHNLENAAKFTAVIESLTDIKELNKTILNKLIDKILVHEAEKVDGKRTQLIDIYYRFVGNINDNVAL